MNQPWLGIDLGGSKIEVAALDGQGAFLLRERVPTPQGDYDATLRAIDALVRTAELRLGATGLPLGVGIPGSLSPLTGRVRNANSTVLNGRPLREDLQALLGRPVRLANDANCLALSEATDGAGAGAEVVFAVILGTGVGAGIAVRGQVLAGCNGIAGEWGHNRLPVSGTGTEADPPLALACWCGRTNCIETWLSGPGLAADHARATGQQLAVPAIVTAMRVGDVAARASLERHAARLARSLGQVINILDPDVIVLGGGLSRIDELCGWAGARLAEHVFSDSLRTRIRPAMHGDSSGVRGAAWLSGLHTGFTGTD
jgi:fructokinase